MKYNIISIGSCMRDIFILNKDLKYSVKAEDPFDPKVVGDKIGVKQMHFDIGGGGSNTAATFANMGLKTALLGRIGDDTAGREVLKVMKSFKVNTNLIEVEKNGETGYSVIFINKSGDRTALVFRGASNFNEFGKLTKSKLKTNWFFITSLNGNLKLLREIFRTAKDNKIKIAWNPGNAELSAGAQKLKNFLYNTDVLFLNLKEAKNLSACSNWQIKNIYKKLTYIAPNSILCVTGGKRGAWVKRDKEFCKAGILDKKVINATGAGDAFGSGFISGMNLYQNDLEKSLQLAMLNSNSVVTQMGAKHGLLNKPPTLKKLAQIKVKEAK